MYCYVSLVRPRFQSLPVANSRCCSSRENLLSLFVSVRVCLSPPRTPLIRPRSRARRRRRRFFFAGGSSTARGIATRPVNRLPVGFPAPRRRSGSNPAPTTQADRPEGNLRRYAPELHVFYIDGLLT